MLVKPFRVSRVHRELPDTISLELKSHDGDTNFAFSPGQFNMLYAYGVGEVPISISGDPAKGGTLVHTIRMVGAVTRAIGKLKPGDSIGVRGPYGNSWPVEEAVGNDVVLVTGGIGLAPLRPVIYHLLANREKYGRVVLLYGARTPEEILFRKDLEKWRSRFDLDIHLTVDRATGSWRGSVGVVTVLIGRAPFDPQHCTTLVCGPEIMMRFTALELERQGVRDEQIYISMERNMKCGVGLCGHCQIGSTFVCKDGPVYRLDKVRSIFTKREM
ncbi:MAG: FAD/NAD(P)-binding protein [bacterium]